MQYKVAQGNMSLIARQAMVGDLDSFGVSMEDFRKLTGEAPWLGTDRNRMQTIFSSVLFASIDALGLLRFKLPAEYLAAGIALFVHPNNMQSACRFFERSETAESLARSGATQENVTAEQLFALVIQLASDPSSSHAKHMFERNTKLALSKVTDESENQTKQLTKTKT